MNNWSYTPFGYDIYTGKIPPKCPHCKEPLEYVNKTMHRRLVWNKVERQYDEDGVNSDFEYTCFICGRPITNIGINGVLVYYRNKEKFEPHELACITHNGEHPFYWKESVGGYVTHCHEVYDSRKEYPKRR